MANEVVGPKLRAGVREVNTRTVLDLVRASRRVTRTELIRRSGLSKATVSVIVATLTEQGFVRASGKLQEGRGRSRAILEFNPRARSLIGAQVGDDECAAVLTDLDGRAYERTAIPLDGTEPPAVVSTIIDAIARLRARAASPVLGLGVGVPGDVDRAGRHISLAVSHGWSDVPMAQLLEDRLNVPVVIANRAKVAALGQLGPDERDRPTDLIYVYLGSGVIAGLVVDGQLCFGRDGGAGDIGHITVQPDGALCGCGNRGCLHTIASEQAILALARSRAREAGTSSMLHTVTDGRLASLTLGSVAAAAQQGDSTATDVLIHVGTQLGLVIANLVNTLNPEAVVLGGPGTQLGQPLLHPIRDEVRRRALTEAAHTMDIAYSQTGEESGATGAAGLWINRMLATSAPTLLLGKESAHA